MRNFTVVLYCHLRSADGASEKTEIVHVEADGPDAAEDAAADKFTNEDPEVLAVFDGKLEDARP